MKKINFFNISFQIISIVIGLFVSNGYSQEIFISPESRSVIDFELEGDNKQSITLINLLRSSH